MQSASRKLRLGNCVREMASGKLRPGNYVHGKLRPGNSVREIASRKLGPGNWVEEIASWKLHLGICVQEIPSGKLRTGKCDGVRKIASWNREIAFRKLRLRNCVGEVASGKWRPGNCVRESVSKKIRPRSAAEVSWSQNAVGMRSWRRVYTKLCPNGQSPHPRRWFHTRQRTLVFLLFFYFVFVAQLCIIP